MPFVIDQNPTYKWKVVVKINKDGEVSEEIFTAHFKNISQSRFKEMLKMVEEKQIDDVDGLAIQLLETLVDVLDHEVSFNSKDVHVAAFHEEDLSFGRVCSVRLVVHPDAFG